MDTTTQIQMMISQIQGEKTGSIDRQDWVKVQYETYLDYSKGHGNGEQNLVDYVKAAKATSKEVFAVVNTEISKVSKEVHEAREINYCTKNDKYMSSKVDLKTEKLVLAPTRATKKVMLVELAKLIVKEGSEENILEAEAILAELCKRYALVEKAVVAE